MTKRAVGSFYMDGRRRLTVNVEANENGTDVGFRLVHDGADRVLRGGGWNDDPQNARVADCVGNVPGFRYFDLGFRLARGNT